MSMEKNPAELAFHGAVHLSARLAFEALLANGWSTEELVQAMGAIQNVHVAGDHSDGIPQVTVAWQQDDDETPELLEELREKGELPLFLWALSARAREPSIC